ncbi:hypothetical protein K2173_013345 [Erythroxylum novogranatense]|uniref:Uncharacterized protein n=1 Tax=Erythroxylum novogranatense TaxID=1862640 RepID=A0AAV8S9M4_9ROSI|nr:hypothetical protein K2173_013345 [Erythroxylum novogranatense]
MARNAILGTYCNRIASRLVLFLCLLVQSCSACELIQSNTFTVSSFSYPQTEVGPFDLSYIRGLEEHIIPKRQLRVICFRYGSLPIPEVLNSYLIQLAFDPFLNGSVREIQDPENVQCYPMKRNITLNLTNEQIPPGVWYLGLFKGIGPTRKQSKTIVRSPAYSFRANMDVEGFTTSTFWSQYCNLTVYPLSCSQSDSNNLAENEPSVYSMEVVDTVEQLTIAAINSYAFEGTP